jgi:3-phosphoinositide dependent protein kinase-1
MGSLNIDVVRLLTCAQILVPISVCHQPGVIHHNIKLENVLLDGRNHIKRTDFGTAMILEEIGTTDLQRSSIVGTPAFVAPELLNDGKIRLSSDIWAFGCLIFNLFTGVAPLAGKNAADLMSHVSTVRFVPEISKVARKAKAVIDSILQIDPTKRLGYGENATVYSSIRGHAFCACIDWDNLSEVSMPLFTAREEEGPPSVVVGVIEEGEKVVMEAVVDWKRMLSSNPRNAVLTNKKRILLFHGKRNSLKQEIRIPMGTKVRSCGKWKGVDTHGGKGNVPGFQNQGWAGGDLGGDYYARVAQALNIRSTR